MSDRQTQEEFDGIFVDASNAFCGNVKVISDIEWNGLRITLAVAGSLFAQRVMRGNMLVSIHVDVMPPAAVAGSGPQPEVTAETVFFPFDPMRWKIMPWSPDSGIHSEPNTALDHAGFCRQHSSAFGRRG